MLFAFSAVLIVPAAYIGIPENYDLGQHLRFARTWNNTLAEGGLVPSWGSADNDGLGSAGVRFYPPATHFVMGLTQFATGGWYDTLWVTMLGWMFVGSVGVFKLAREWCSSSVALYSALLYAIVPYHLLQVFQAFLLAEFAAAAFLPFCFLYTHRLVVKGGLINILLFAVAYSALILTHLPTTIMGTLSLAVFALAFMSAGNFVRSVGRFALAFAIAATATAFYWVRMVSELSWIKHNTPEYYASGLYNYSTYFFPMLYSSGEAYVARFLWLIDIVIVVTFALLIPALIVVVKKKSEVPRHLIALLSVAGLALFMMSILSEPLWDSIDLLQKLQFPYRWLSPGSLVAALLFPIGIAALAEERSMITRPFAYSLASIFMLLVV
ncbi:MAG TPA: 6-pyruvoyl-tetrahydropterin synthase-related protein, partial [Pyrinomonadaceae bacterium]